MSPDQECFGDRINRVLLTSDHTEVVQTLRLNIKAVPKGSPLADQPFGPLTGQITGRCVMLNRRCDKILFWLDDDETPIHFDYVIKGELKYQDQREAKWHAEDVWSTQYLDVLKTKTSCLMYQPVTTTGKKYFDVLNDLARTYMDFKAALIDGCSYDERTSEKWYLTQHRFTREWHLDIEPREEHVEDPDNWVVKTYQITALNWNPVMTALREAIASQIIQSEGPYDGEIVI